VVVQRAYDALVNASYLSAGPDHHPRAPSTLQLPGDILPTGVAQWLHRSPDFPLLYDMAQHGASLHYVSEPWPQGTVLNRVPGNHEAEIDRQILAEVHKGWLVPVPAGSMDVVNAPLQVSEEVTKVRRITDYSNVVDGERTGMNALVDMHALGEAPMQRSRDLAQAVRQLWQTHGCAPQLLVRDVSKAFRRIGVCPRDAASLRIQWRGQDYCDVRLPFGHAASAHLCCKLTSAVAAAVTSHFEGMARVLAYVDDFILIAHPAVAPAVEGLFNIVMRDVGLPMSESKADEAGSWNTRATWIGFEHDTERCTHALPPAKKSAICQLITAVTTIARRDQPVKRTMWDTLVGKLSHVSSVFTVGRAFMTELYSVAAQAGSSLRISPAAMTDLAWWTEALDRLPRSAAMRKAPTLGDKAMITDASLSGQGIALFATAEAALHSRMDGLIDAAYGRISPRGVPGDMMWLEVVAARSAVQRWGHLFAGATGYIIVDNEPLEWAWRKGRSKSARVNAVLRDIMMLLLHFDAQIFPLRVQSKANLVADALSRRYEPGGSTFPEWLARHRPQQLTPVSRLPHAPLPSRQ